MPKAPIRKAPIPSRNGHGKHPITAPGHNRLEPPDADYDQQVERRIKNLQGLLGRFRPVPPEWLDPPEPKDSMIPIMTCMSDVKPKRVEWYCKPWLAAGKETVLVGDPGHGKSAITIYFMARFSTGGPWLPWPGQSERTKPGNVVFVTAEDDLADTVVPRLMVAGADLSRIKRLNCVEYQGSGGGKDERDIDLSKHLPAIEKAIKQNDAKLLVLDPVSAYLGKTDSHNNAEVRGVLERLSAIAEKHRVAILFVSHMNKDDAKAAIYRTSGSMAFIAKPRIAVGVTRDKNDPERQRRLFLTIKNNLVAGEPGLAYSMSPRFLEIEGETVSIPMIEWESVPVDIAIDDVMGSTAKGPKPEKRLEAERWLRGALAAGPRLAKELEKEATLAGIAERTLDAAKQQLGIKSERDPEKRLGPWWWKLPEAVRAPSTPPPESKRTKRTKRPKETTGKP